MDFLTHADLTGRIRGLVIMLDEKITIDESRRAEDLVDGDEFGAALETLAGFLAEAGTPLPADLPRGLRSALDAGRQPRRGDGGARALPVLLKISGGRSSGRDHPAPSGGRALSARSAQSMRSLGSRRWRNARSTAIQIVFENG